MTLAGLEPTPNNYPVNAESNSLMLVDHAEPGCTYVANLHLLGLEPSLPP